MKKISSEKAALMAIEMCESLTLPNLVEKNEFM